MSASLVLPLILIEVVTVVLGVRSLITLHVAVGLVLIGPMLLKLGSVTYRMVSYYRSVSEYRRHGKPSNGARLLGGALSILILLLLTSGLVLIVGPSALGRTARSVHVATAYLTVAIMTAHLAIHLPQALRLASADTRPHAPIVRGRRARWLALAASLALGGGLALLLGGHGTSYLNQHNPGYPAHTTTAAFRHPPRG